MDSLVGNPNEDDMKSHNLEWDGGPGGLILAVPAGAAEQSPLKSRQTRSVTRRGQHHPEPEAAGGGD